MRSAASGEVKGVDPELGSLVGFRALNLAAEARIQGSGRRRFS
ncbi:MULTISPECIES: hypothetical protein [unclassified Halomonas]